MEDFAPRKVPWYGNPYIVLTALVSVLAVSFALLLLLLLFVLPRTSEIIRYAQGNMLALRSVHVEADAAFKNAGSKSFTWHSVGNLAKDGDAVSSNAAFTLTVGEQPTRVFVGEHLRAGAADKFRFSDLPETVGAAHFGQLRGKWLQLWHKAVQDLVVLPLFGADHRAMSDADAVAIAEYVRKTQFFTVQQRLPDEPQDGVSTHHYVVRTDDNNVLLRDVYQRVEAARLGRPLTDKEQAAALNFFASLKISDVQLWIGGADRNLYRMKVTAAYDGITKGDFTLDLRFSQFNVATVAADADAQPEDVTPIITSLLAGLRGHLPLAKLGTGNVITGSGGSGLPIDVVGAAESDGDADKDGLSNGLERFYLTDPAIADTDGDGVNDGDEVLAGCNPIGHGWMFDFGANAATGAGDGVNGAAAGECR